MYLDLCFDRACVLLCSLKYLVRDNMSRSTLTRFESCCVQSLSLQLHFSTVFHLISWLFTLRGPSSSNKTFRCSSSKGPRNFEVREDTWLLMSNVFIETSIASKRAKHGQIAQAFRAALVSSRGFSASLRLAPGTLEALEAWHPLLLREFDSCRPGASRQ